MSRYSYKSLVVLIVCALLFAISIPLFCEEREGCEVCGMWIDQYMSTRHVVILKDNTIKRFCSLACAVKYIDSNKEKVKEVRVADFLTQKLIDAERAFYIEGSDVPGVMSYISRIAFSTQSEAVRFRKGHGGKIITFKEAMENQLRGD